MTESVETTETVTEEPQGDPRWTDATQRTWEVVYTNGNVEHVKGHFVSMPARDFSLYGDKNRDNHVTFAGYYGGVHRTALIVRAELIDSIRDIELQPSPRIEFPRIEFPVNAEPGDDNTGTSDADKTPSL